MKAIQNVQNSQKAFLFEKKCNQGIKNRYQFAVKRVVIHFLHTLFITALSDISALYERRQSKKINRRCYKKQWQSCERYTVPKQEVECHAGSLWKSKTLHCNTDVTLCNVGVIFGNNMMLQVRYQNVQQCFGLPQNAH